VVAGGPLGGTTARAAPWTWSHFFPSERGMASWQRSSGGNRVRPRAIDQRAGKASNEGIRPLDATTEAGTACRHRRPGRP
jgi:hypothetical protein